MTTTKHPLDSFLPMLEPDAPAVLDGVEVLEVRDMAQLLELSRDPKIGRYLLARLSDTVALIDPGTAEDLIKALRAAGHTPRTTKGLQR
jgi:hypothetical protein